MLKRALFLYPHVSRKEFVLREKNVLHVYFESEVDLTVRKISDNLESEYILEIGVGDLSVELFGPLEELHQRLPVAAAKIHDLPGQSEIHYSIHSICLWESGCETLGEFLPVPLGASVHLGLVPIESFSPKSVPEGCLLDSVLLLWIVNTAGVDKSVDRVEIVFSGLSSQSSKSGRFPYHDRPAETGCHRYIGRSSSQ